MMSTTFYLYPFSFKKQQVLLGMPNFECTKEESVTNSNSEQSLSLPSVWYFIFKPNVKGFYRKIWLYNTKEITVF